MPWLAVAALVGAVYVAFKASSATLPLLIAFVLAYFLAPLVRRLEGRGWPRGVVVVGIALCFVGVIAGGGYLFGPRLVAAVRQLVSELAATVVAISAEVEARWDIAVPHGADGWLGMIESGGTHRMVASLTHTVGGFLVLLTVPILGFLVLHDWERIVAFLRAQVPRQHRDLVDQITRDLDLSLRRLLRGMVLVASILAVLYTLGFWLVGTPRPLLVGLVSGIGNMIPFVGTTIGIVLALTLVLLGDGSITTALLTLGVFAAVQLLESWIITPRIVGAQVGLPPLAVLCAVLVFGDLFGVVGVFLAVPVAITLRVIGSAVLERYHASAVYRGETAT